MSSKSFAENEYEDSQGWEWKRHLEQTLDMSPKSFAEETYEDGQDWMYSRRLENVKFHSGRRLAQILPEKLK
jgi:hypothetical protein